MLVTMYVAKNKYGFTLVELLVVISILSILSIITFSQFQTAQRKARDAQRKSDISNTFKALQMYAADYGFYPDADAAGKIMIGGSSISWGGEFVDGNYVYMKVLPKENSILTKPYCYKVNAADKKKMGIFAVLENDQDKDFNNLNNGSPYSCGGQEYNFGIVSSNTSYAEL